MVEALSCGTPVIGMNRGSIPEIIEHGKTGILCETMRDAVRAVSEIDDIEPISCFESALERFSRGRMVDDYEKTFKSILDSYRREDIIGMAHRT
jgi:glycosyltransferase involved in cell wall biosynthesis